MLEGYYSIASGMMTQQKRLNVIGNNIVNSQTPGYRAETVVVSAFENELEIRKEAYATASLGSGSAPITLVEEVPTMFNSGNLKKTDRGMDMAINGPGYFSIQTADGGRPLLTRNGQFDVDDAGYLILPNVGRVMGENGPLRLNTTNFLVEGDGTIVDANNNRLGKIALTAPGEGVELERLENGMYRAPAGTQMAVPQNSGVMQEFLELSNVDFNVEYTNMMAAQRSFQACSTALQIADELNQKSATQIASL